MQNTDFLMSLIFAHLIGDYVFQTSRLAKNKANSIRGIIKHGIVVLCTNIIILGNYGLIGELAAILTSSFHFFIDYIKMRTKKYCKFDTVHNLIDQISHFIVLISCDYCFRNLVPDPLINIKYIGALNYLILITYVSTVIAKTILYDTYENNSLSSDFFIKYERLFDCLIILIVVFAFINIFLGIVFLSLAAIVFYFIQTKYFKYSTKQTILKAVIYLIFICIFRFLVNF